MLFVLVFQPNERFNEISKFGLVQIGIEMTEEMTMSSFDLSEGRHCLYFFCFTMVDAIGYRCRTWSNLE